MEQETRTARDAGAPVKIGAEAVRAAAEVLRRYRAGKQNLDRRIIDNEQFWKLRHWEQMEKAGEGGNPEDVRPASGWLVNCILSKHADAMDCYPEPTVLPREPGDRQEAETLSRILPVLLKNDRFRRTYSKAWWDKLKSGCAVYGVFWDNEKLHGLGDVSIRSMDVLNLFWEPGVTDIQESEHFFCTELVPNNHLVRRWPELEGKLGRGSAQVSRYLFDDKVDTSEQSLVVDWYYHTEREGRQVLQYCKFVGENVLYATENDPEMAARGWYDHGKYPFVFDTLFPEEGTPCGYGYVDLCKSAQKQIDLMNQAILKNTLAAATAAAQGGASVRSVQFRFAGQELTGTAGTTAVIGISGTLRPTVTVTDSRGRSVTVTGEAVTVAAYYPPAITASMAARCAADGTEKDDGAYLKVKCAAQCADVQGHNAVVLRARFRPVGGAWNGYVTLLPGAEQLLGGGLDGGTSYEVELSAEDTVGNVRVVRYTAATSRVTLHLRAGGMGAAFGKYAEQEALECVWPAVFYGDVAVSGALTVNGQTVEAMLFPVGSVRLTDSPAAPETPAGAAWESVETGIAGVYGWRRTT